MDEHPYRAGVAKLIIPNPRWFGMHLRDGTLYERLREQTRAALLAEE